MENLWAVYGRAVMMNDEKKQILVVDDVPDNILFLIDLLGNDYCVKTATSARTALNILSESPLPDLILVDVMVPSMSGFELCQQLKSNHITSRIPVVFISGNTDQGTYEEGFSLGGAGFLSKPIVAETLHATIQTTLAQSALIPY